MKLKIKKDWSLLELLLDPSFSFPISIGIGLSLITLTDNTNNIVGNFLYHYRLSICKWLCGYVIISFLYKTVIFPKNVEIERLNTIIDEKNRQLEHIYGVVYNKYGEFARFAKDIRFKGALKKFVDNNSVVESAQIYKLSKKKVGSDIVINLQFETGYAYPCVDINAIFQTTYKLDYARYMKFREDVWRRWLDVSFKHDNLGKKARLDVYNKMVTSIEELINELYKELKGIKSADEVSDKDFINYRLFTILARLAAEMEGGNIKREDSYSVEFDWAGKEDIEKKLQTGKRTGILGGILLEDSFSFSHMGNSSKKGRLYNSFYMSVNGQPYIVLYSLARRDLDRTETLEDEKNELENNFIKLLRNGE